MGTPARAARCATSACAGVRGAVPPDTPQAQSAGQPGSAAGRRCPGAEGRPVLQRSNAGRSPAARAPARPSCKARAASRRSRGGRIRAPRQSVAQQTEASPASSAPARQGPSAAGGLRMWQPASTRSHTCAEAACTLDFKLGPGICLGNPRVATLLLASSAAGDMATGHWPVRKCTGAARQQYLFHWLTHDVAIISSKAGGACSELT